MKGVKYKKCFSIADFIIGVWKPVVSLHYSFSYSV